MAENTEPFDVAAERDRLLKQWNPPPEDHTLERVVGVATNPEDVAATAHVPMADRNAHIQASGPMPHDSGVDAGLLGAVGADEYNDDLSRTLDSEQEVDYDGLKGEALNDALEERGLPKTGTADEKRERVRAFDAGELDEDEDDESED